MRATTGVYRCPWAAFALAVTLVALVPAAPLAAENTECYEPGNTNSGSIYPYLRYYEDATEEIAGPQELEAKLFRSLPYDTVSMGFTDSTYWFKLCVLNSSAPDAPGELILSLPNTYLEHVEIFFGRDGRSATSVARLGLQSDAPEFWPVYIFRMAPGEEVQILLRIHSRSPLRFSAAVQPALDFNRNQALMNYLVGGMIAAIMALAIYNLILYFQLQDPNYLLYFSFMAFVSCYRIFFHGLPVPFLSEFLRVHYLLITLVLAEMTAFFIFRWMLVFLNVRQHSRAAAIFVNVLAWTSLPTIAFAFYQPFATNQFIAIKAIVTIVMCIPVPILIWRRGYRPALWFIIAFALAPINITLLILGSYGLTPFDLLTRLSVDITNLTQALLLSLALADRIRLSELESRAKLESRVDERTRALQSEVKLRTVAQKRAESATRAREAFLANMSHEIRTPMNAILGMADLLEETALDETQQEYIHTFQRAGRNLQRLLSDVLDISKVDSGELAIRDENFDLHALLRDLARIHGSVPRSPDVALEFEQTEKVPQWIRGDVGRVSQILTNLVSNALKFTHLGFVRVSVSIEAEDSGSETLNVRVRDTGVGVSNEELKRIFERFYQSDTTYARRTGGSGLGLAISHRLAELMGGELVAESVPGQGSEFQLRLPCLPGLPPDIIPARSPGGIEGTAPDFALSKSSRILGVDDSEDNRELLRHYFKKSPHQLDLAESGPHAIEKIQEKDYAIVLMDIQMPQMDGFETTRRLREVFDEHPARPRAQIVALTAYVTEREVAAIREFGFDAYLQKPIARRDLLEAIDALLSDADRAEGGQQSN